MNAKRVYAKRVDTLRVGDRILGNDNELHTLTGIGKGWGVRILCIDGHPGEMFCIDGLVNVVDDSAGLVAQRDCAVDW